MKRTKPFNFAGQVVLVLVILSFSLSTGALNPNHECSYCHLLHSAPGQSLNCAPVVEALCLSCHGDGLVAVEVDVHLGDKYGTFKMTCMDCHNPHSDMTNRFGGTNLLQVGRKTGGSSVAVIDTPNSGPRYVVFQERGTDAGGLSQYSFADNDEDGDGYYDGVCEACHTQPTYHRNDSSGDHSHYMGRTCTICHKHVENFLPSGGCTACHSVPQDKGDGPPTRRAMVGEFALTGHHVSGGAVTDDDCAVCHLEAVNSGYHMNNMVDLLNPDDTSLSAVVSFAQFSRNTSSDTLESWVMDVQDNFCMKCHDPDGASASNISGNPLRPFSSGDRDVPDVFSRFDPGNSYYHAVRGAGSNPYCIPGGSNGNIITMEPPWNQDSTHDVISCFDCHVDGGHGSPNQRMLRTAIDFDAIEAAVDPASLPAEGGNIETFCTRCHKSTVYLTAPWNSETAGSIFEYHSVSGNRHSSSGGNTMGCMGCHGGIVNFNAGTPPDGNGAARGNIHGGTFVWPPWTFSSGDTTEHFMVGGWISGWHTVGSTGECGGGACAHKGGPKQAGRTYTR